MKHSCLAITCPCCLAEVKIPDSSGDLSFQCRFCQNRFEIIITTISEADSVHAQPVNDSESHIKPDDGISADNSEPGSPSPSHPDISQQRPATSEQPSERDVRYLLMVSQDRLKAYMQICGRDQGSATIEDIQEILQKNKICQGVPDLLLIKGILKYDEVRKKPFKVAEGEEARPGKDAGIRYFFDTDYLKIGIEKEQGNIDFRDRGKIPHVGTGDLLAEKIHAVQGEPGIDIFGNPIAVKKPADIKLRCDRGAVLSEDKCRVYAKTDGRPDISLGGRISVISEIKISGDVDLKTGHIDFPGNVTVSGAVCEKFCVKGHDITAREIYGAKINASGDVRVSGGIVGAMINTRGTVAAKFIRESRILAYGDIIAGKEIIDCELSLTGACRVIKGKIISSRISAKQGIEAADIGTPVSNASRLRVGVSDHLDHEYKGIDEALSARKKELEKLESQKNEMQNEQHQLEEEITKLCQFQDKLVQARLKLDKQIRSCDSKSPQHQIRQSMELSNAIEQKLRSTVNVLGELKNKQNQIEHTILKTGESEAILRKEIDDLEAEKKGLLQWGEKQKPSPEVKTTGLLQAGTMITGPNSTIRIADSLIEVGVRETKITSPESHAQWEMTISSLK